jgi:SAM-dependent methyltransferase
VGTVGTYDAIGRTYAATLRPDPRIAVRIHAALGDATSVVNVGAGTGSYEPASTALAVEPSAVMIAQRPAGSAPAVRAVAEAMPLRDGAVDAALAVLTVHHWTDLAAGIAELRRVARWRVVLLVWEQPVTGDFWLPEYFPGSGRSTVSVPLDRLTGLLGGARVEVVPVPHDCVDGFGAAYWRRPEAYLDPVVRAGISSFAREPAERLRAGLERLAADLASGAWHDRYADLLALDELDLGYRLLVAEL